MLIDKLLQLDSNDLTARAQGEIEIKRLSEITGEPFILKMRGLSTRQIREITEFNSGKNQDGYKIVGFEGTGSFKVHKTTSYFIDKLAPSIKAGQQVLFTLVSELDDPDAVGTERVALYNCQVDSVDLINWSLDKLGEEEYNFTFEDYELLDAAFE